MRHERLCAMIRRPKCCTMSEEIRERDAAAPSAAPRSAVSPGERTVMFHDGACPLCSIEVAHYRALDRDGAVDFVDASDPNAEAALAARGLSRAQALQRLHVIDADGRVVSGARAFIALWRRLPGWRRLAPIAGAPPIVWVLEGLYRLFLPLRPALAFIAARLAPRRRVADDL